MNGSLPDTPPLGSDGGSAMQQPGAIRTRLAQLRVEQWAKNLLVFAPLVFALRLASPTAVGRSFLAVREGLRAYIFFRTRKRG